MNDFSGATIGRYRIIKLLGEGGAAHTYLAEDTSNGERLAVKEMRLLKSRHTKQIELFERECATLRDLRHPQIPKFIDTIVDRREETLSLFLVQEFIDGRSLQQMLEDGFHFTSQDVVAIAQSCLEPLDYLHQRNPPLFHRDIKPSNIIRRPDGTCVLVDFGAVREAVIDAKTHGSSVVGTFGYMAPEQFQARAYPGTDLYGLGATLLHLRTGVEPGKFPLVRLKPAFHDHLKDDPRLAAILDILMEPTVEDRYASVASLRNALDRWQKEYPLGPNDVQALPASVITPEDLVRSTPSGGSPAPGPSASPVATSPQVPAPVASEPEERAGGEAAGRKKHKSRKEREREKERERSAARVAASAAARSGPMPALSAPASTSPAAPAAAPADAGNSAAARPAEGDLNEKPTPTVQVITENAPPWELLLPGGQGAIAAGGAGILLGVIVAGLSTADAVGDLSTALGYLGLALVLAGLVLLVVPRRYLGASASGGRSGTQTAEVAVRYILKRVGYFGKPEWYVEYEFQAQDGLSYQNRYRIPNAAAAREIAKAPHRLRVRYDDLSPDAAVLSFTR